MQGFKVQGCYVVGVQGCATGARCIVSCLCAAAVGGLCPLGCLAASCGAAVLRSRRGQGALLSHAPPSPLEVVVAMGPIVASFPPALYILHLAFSQCEQ